jgi:hypothetical protein
MDNIAILLILVCMLLARLVIRFGVPMKRMSKATDSTIALQEKASTDKNRYQLNARQRLTLKTLLDKVVSRHELDTILSVENSPDVIWQLRRKGWKIRTHKFPELGSPSKSRLKKCYYLSFLDEADAAHALGLAEHCGGHHGTRS